MKSLQDRVRAEEAMFANRQAAEFAVWAGGLRRLGEWAAREMMGANAPAVSAYAEALVRSGVAGADAFRSVAEDLKLAGLEQDAAALQSRFSRCLEEARARNSV